MGRVQPNSVTRERSCGVASQFVFPPIYLKNSFILLFIIIAVIIICISTESVSAKQVLQLAAASGVDMTDVKMSPGLQRLLDQADEMQPLRVIVRLKNGSSTDQLDSIIKNRRARHIRKLKHNARIKQKKILPLLDHRRSDLVNKLRKKGKLKHHKINDSIPQNRSFWLVNCVAATVTPLDLKEIASRPDVLDISENTVLSVPPVTTNGSETLNPVLNLWNLSAIGLDQISGHGIDGRGVRLGFIDTGFDPSHADLAGKMIVWAEFDSHGEIIHSAPHDTHTMGHGTHVASVLAGDITGIAPGASLIAALALPGGSGTMEQVLAGMQWILDPDNDPETEDGAQIVNMSWGSSNLSPVLNDAVENMAAADVLPVCSIGNSGPGRTVSPGNAPKAIGVGALEPYNRVAAYSGGGEVCWTEEFCLTKPDIVAPGYSIPGIGLGGEYQTRSGTSFAAPHVAGAAALLLQANPDMTLSQLRGFLLNTAVDYGAIGPDVRFGRGRLDIPSAFDFIDRYALRFDTQDLVLEQVESSENGHIHLYSTYYSNGEGRVEDPLTLTVLCESDFCHTLGLADVDGDGYSDLVVSQTEPIDTPGYRHLVKVYRALDAGGFSQKAQTWFRDTSDSFDPLDVIGLADVNGDRKADLVLRHYEEMPWYYDRTNIHVCLSNGRDSFETQDQEWATVDHHDLLEVVFGLGDPNGDGRADLIHSERIKYFPVPMYYYLHLSEGNGFESYLSPVGAVTSSYSGRPLRLLSMADADGDGFDDLILAGEVVTPASETPVYVSLSRGAGSTNGFFSEQVWSYIPLQSGGKISAVTDVDGDGFADLVIKTGGVNPQIDLWLSDGWNHFEKRVDEWFDAKTISSASDFEVVGAANIGLGSWH